MLQNWDWKLFFSVTGVVFLSEMGDKTQVTTLLLAGSKPLYVFWVALGSASALICTAFLEVLIGSHLLVRWLTPERIRLLSGLAFLGLGLLLVSGLIGSITIPT